MVDITSKYTENCAHYNTFYNSIDHHNSHRNYVVSTE